MYLSENKEDLLGLNTSEEAINSGLKYYTVYSNDLSQISPSEIELRWGEVNFFRRWEKQNDAFWCKNKRKARFQIGIGMEVNYFNDPIVGKLTQRIYYREAYVQARRKGIPCIWYAYKTKIIWNDFDSEYDTFINGVTNHWVWTAQDVTEENVSKIKRGESIHVGYDERGDIFDCQWTKIQSNITTRGIWDKWLKVDWQD